MYQQAVRAGDGGWVRVRHLSLDGAVRPSLEAPSILVRFGDPAALRRAEPGGVQGQVIRPGE